MRNADAVDDEWGVTVVWKMHTFRDLGWQCQLCFEELHPLSTMRNHPNQSICDPDDRMPSQRTITDSAC